MNNCSAQPPFIEGDRSRGGKKEREGVERKNVTERERKAEKLN